MLSWAEAMKKLAWLEKTEASVFSATKVFCGKKAGDSVFGSC